MSKSNELRNQRAALTAEAKNIINAAEAESRDLTPEERGSFDSKMADVEALAIEIQKAERKEAVETVEAELKVSQGRRTVPTVTTGPAVALGERDRKEAVRAWALAGTNSADNSSETSIRAAQCGIALSSNTLELRALSKGTNTLGGYSVPTTMSNQIEKALKYYSNVRKFCKTLTTATGADFQYPKVDDTANSGAVVTEAGAPAVNVDPTFGQVTFKAAKYHSDIVKVSVELLQDSIVDVESLLADMLAERIARKQETDFMTGTGSGTAINGLITGAAVGVNLASGNAITFAKLKSLEHSVDIAYRQNGAFLMHDATWAAIEQMVDGNQRPLFLPGYEGLSNSSQKRLFGYPVYISNQFVAYTGAEGDNAAMILFGDFQRYLVRDVAEGFQITRFNELYAGNGQVGFQLWQRVWGDYIGPSGCVKALNSYDAP